MLELAVLMNKHKELCMKLGCLIEKKKHTTEVDSTLEIERIGAQIELLKELIMLINPEHETEYENILPGSIARRLDYIATTTMNVEKLLKTNKKHPIVLSLLGEVKETAEILINTIKSDYQ